jgi:hypothetical protein
MSLLVGPVPRESQALLVPIDGRTYLPATRMGDVNVSGRAVRSLPPPMGHGLFRESVLPCQYLIWMLAKAG